MTNESDAKLKSMASDIAIMRQLLGKVVNYMVNAEEEVSEKMRRFIMYFHDLHDMKNFYNEHGVEPPSYIMREIERCDDRLRQLVKEAHADGGTFEKVRREMAADPDNKWNHERELIFKPQRI
jgi:hypothetical protein